MRFRRDDPLFRPLWLRLVLLALPLLAAAYAFAVGSVGWGIPLGLLAGGVFQRMFLIPDRGA